MTQNEGTKILIYAAANVVNAGRMVGWNFAKDAILSARDKNALLTPIEVYDSYTDRLINDGCLLENTVVLEADRNRIEILNAVIDVTKKNKITETPLVNRTGKVKERIQEEDYTVVVKGSLVGKKDCFPHAELLLLNRILSGAKSIDIASVYTSIFDIEKVALTSANFNQSTWNYFNEMPFTLTFSSDADYNFLMNE